MYKLGRVAQVALICLATGVLVVVAFSSTVSGSMDRPFRIEPEYDRKLEKVVLSLETSTEDLSLHEDILKSLPEYSEVLMLVPERRSQDIGRQLEALGLSSKVRLVPFSSRVVGKEEAYRLYTRNSELRKLSERRLMPRGSVWAQDLFEVAMATDGTRSIIAPFIHKWFIKPGTKWGPRLESDNAFVEALGSWGIEFNKLPLVFKGGNVLVDEFEGKSIAFAGGDIIRDTRLVLDATIGKKVTEAEVVEWLRLCLKVDRLVVISRNMSQPEKMFHLDQAMVLFPDGVAGVTRIVDYKKDMAGGEVDEVRRLLSELRGELRRLGYRIVDIGATVEDVNNYRYYVNGVPYVNKKTGRREFLMPLFEISLEGRNGEVYRKNVLAVESLGYRVIPVPTSANERRGGIHCMVNVIS
ncbi:MAG TPA: hypothetical protein ENI12_06070 [Nitrospirae bacterium]|nr:hypothetical protein [Nitrospirota bacterium]